MRTNILLVVFLAFLCVDTTLSRPVKPASHKADKLRAAASGLEKRLKSIGKHASSHVHKERSRNHRRKVREMEEDDGDKEDKAGIMAAADADDIAVEADETPEEAKERSGKENKRMIAFLVSCIICIIVLGLIGYQVNKMNNPDVKILDYFGFSEMVPVNVLVGMGSGLVFGFIDNAGLFFGMEYMDPFFSKLPRGDEEKVLSGYGNTFSDCIGAFLGTFAGSIIKDVAIKYMNYNEADEYPIWSEAVGITIGCIIGVLVPRAILGDPKVKRLSAAQAEALANGVTQEQIDEVMKEFDRLDKETDKERPGAVRVENLKNATPGSIDKFIAQADKAGDNDGWVTREEIMELLVKANKRYKSAQQGIINKQDTTTTNEGEAKEKKD